MEVDPGRVISSAISMTFTLIANISSVKVRGHVSSSSRGLRPRAGRGGGGVGGEGVYVCVWGGWYLIALDANAVSIS